MATIFDFNSISQFLSFTRILMHIIILSSLYYIDMYFNIDFSLIECLDLDLCFILNRSFVFVHECDSSSRQHIEKMDDEISTPRRTMESSGTLSTDDEPSCTSPSTVKSQPHLHLGKEREKHELYYMTVKNSLIFFLFFLGEVRVRVLPLDI